jgi:cytochrome c2
MKINKKNMFGNMFKGFLCLITFMLFVHVSFSQRSEIYPLPENPLKGSQVFIDKGCIKCHTIWGIGDTFGPDLTRIGQEKDFFELSGALWSHSPKMIEVMKEKDVERPMLTPEETQELMAYLYYLGFFDELGDYIKGEEIFSRKGCVQCHSLGGMSKKGGPSLDKYGRFVSPVFIAAALWNHSLTISEVMVEQSFAPQEMSHLLAFIKGNALNEKGETIYMNPGSPNRGRDVFGQKKCTACHGNNDLDLEKSSLRKSLTEIVRMMWNHSYEMWEIMKETGLQVPRFNNEEMADLMTYLYFIQYYGEKGDRKRGEKIYAEKGCISCHSKEAVEQNKGIDLSEVSTLTSFELISVMWNHIPQMEKMLTEMNLLWPRFEKAEMRDLIQYIQSLSSEGGDND